MRMERFRREFTKLFFVAISLRRVAALREPTSAKPISDFKSAADGVTPCFLYQACVA